MNYTKILSILSIIFIILIIIYIIFKNKYIQVTTSPNYSYNSYNNFDDIDKNTIIKMITKNEEDIYKLPEIKKLTNLCPHNISNFNILKQFLIDLLNYKEGLISKKYMDNWYNVCNGKEDLKKF